MPLVCEIYGPYRQNVSLFKKQADVEYVDAVMFLDELLKMLDMRNKV